MIFGLKTSSETTEFYLYGSADSKTAMSHESWESKRELSEQLLGKMTNFIESHGTKLHDLKGIIIYSGPGSFTSLRIGHSVVNALADSLEIPVCGAKDPNWEHSALKALKSVKLGTPALPFYGAEAHITRPKS